MERGRDARKQGRKKKGTRKEGNKVKAISAELLK